MDIAMHELPLTLFTTLAPIGAGAFITFFIVFLRGSFDEAQVKRLDRLTIVPLLFAIVGLGCSFAHLANPGNAFNVVNTMGSTPLANEILWFSVFLILAVIYWIVALAGGLKSKGLRLLFSGAVALVGAVSVVFMGLAYFIPAIPVWNSPSTVLQMLGAWLFGGVALGMVLCALVGKHQPDSNGDEMTCKVLMILGAVVLIASTVMIFVAGANATSPVINVSANASSLMTAYVISIAIAVVGAVCGFLGKGRNRTALFTCALVLAIIAIFLARLVFYGMQIGIGL